MSENSKDASAGNPASNSTNNPANNSVNDRAKPTPARQPYPSAPNDEEVGDEGIVQADAGDDSFLVDLPPEPGRASDSAAPPKRST